MVHNGIEYGLMQAYAEGFNILRNADPEERPEDERYHLDLPTLPRSGGVAASSAPGCSTSPPWPWPRIPRCPGIRGS